MAEEIGQAQDVQSTQGVFEDRADAGKGNEGEVKLWLQAIELASKEESAWREKRAPETIDIYRDATDRKRKRYNILYANTEVLAQSIYNSRAMPDVRARYQEADPVATITARVLERALSYSCDDSQHDFDACIKGAVKDILLPGRCVDRVRYEPTIEKRNKRISLIPDPMPDPATGQPSMKMIRVDTGAYLDPEMEIKTDAAGAFADGDEYEQITYEECYVEHVQWADFRRGPAKQWDEVPWIAFKHYLTRAQLEELNPKIGATMPLDTAVASDARSKSPDNGTAPAPDIFKRGMVWEVWDKEKRKVIWVAPSYKDDVLRRDDDPLNLNQFYPIPRPVLAVEVPETLVPVEPYRLYKDQADELDIITRRLAALTRVAKWRGLYGMPEGGTELTTLQDADDGDLVPSQTAAAVAAGGGDIGKYIWLMPIEQVAQTINLLSQRQQVVKENIYEIMGIADILRGGGGSRSHTTAKEAQIKAQSGSIRVQHLQQEVQRYVRDIFRLMSEIIAEKYQPQTLQLITGLQIPPEVIAVLRSDAMRCFKVDIETDSTIQADLQRFQENAQQFVEGTAAFFNAMGPAAEKGAIAVQDLLDMFKGLSRMYKLPRQAQEAIERMKAPPPPQQNNQGDQAKAQAEMARAQADMQIAQIDGQTAQQQGAIDSQRASQDAQLAQLDHGLKTQQTIVAHNAAMTQIAAKTQATLIAAKAKGSA